MKTLTPRDTPVFDEFMIADLEKSWGEPLLCDEDERSAVARIVCTRCGNYELTCAEHTDWALRAIATDRYVGCVKCRFEGKASDVVKVVSL